MHELSPIRIVIAGFRAFWLDSATARMVPVVCGAADGPAPEEASTVDVPATFDGLTEDDLRDLHGRLESRFTEERAGATTRLQLDTLRGYREAQKRISDEITRRNTEAAELAEGLNSLDDPSPLPDPPAEPDPEAEDPEAPADPENPATPADPAAPTPEAIAAGLTAADIAAGRTPQTPAERAPAPARTGPRVPMRAAASQQVVPFGQEVNLDDIGRIATGVKNGLDGTHGEVKAFVASVGAFEDMGGDLGTELLSTMNGTVRNDELIREAVEAHMARRAARMGRPVPQTAAICAPLDIIREIPDYVSQADPLSGAFPSRPISRLGFNYTPAIALADVATGVRTGWDEAAQAAVDPTNQATWKPVYDATCGSPSTIIAEASTAAVRFDVTTEMSNPERIRDIMSKLTAARIRARTNRLLGIIDALSLSYTRTGDYSLFPDTVYAVNDLLTRLSYGERLDAEDYTLFVAPGFPDYLVNDIMGKEFQSSEEYAEGEASVLARLSKVCGGIEVIELRDDPASLYPALPAVATPTVLSDVPCAWPLRLVHTPSAIYGSTGLIDTGIMSDPSLARMNKRQWFQEEYTLLAKHGSPPWAKLVLTSVASGSRAAASTKLACA